MQELYYCTECLHIYHKMPDKNICVICNNEISPNDKINKMEYLVCETCFSLYSAQKPGEIIPKGDELNLSNGLCKCKNHCPPNTLFEHVNENEQIFLVGSIVLADLYQCQNCKAAYFWNREKKSKHCVECNAKLVVPMNFNPEEQNIIFSCANPNHGIRLKGRDLLLNHNDKIQAGLIQRGVPYKEQELREQFTLKENEIKNQSGVFKSKKKEEQLRKLGEWAKNERKSLYTGLETRALICSVYKMVQKDGKAVFTKTSNGCGALSQVRLRKIIQSDNKSTVFGSAPSEDSLDGSSADDGNKLQDEEKYRPSIVDFGKPQENLVEDGPDDSALDETITSSSSIDSDISQESPMEQSIDSTEIDSNTKTFILPKENNLENRETIDDILLKLPSQGKKQLYIGIEILDEDINSPPKNLGFLPIEIKEDINQITLGKKDFLQAYWKNPEFISEIKNVFDNISNNQITLLLENNKYVIKPDDNPINSLLVSHQDENDSEPVFKPLIELVDLQEIGKNPIYLKTYNYLHKFIFKIIFKVPTLEV